MLYSIGYQAIRNPDTLRAICEALNVQLIDARAKSRARAGFTGRDLSAMLGDRYERHGHHLGGFGNVKPDGIDYLRQFDGEDKPNALVMCFEEHPGVCHRHIDILGPHFPTARHILPFEGVWDYYTAKTISEFEPDGLRIAPEPDGDLGLSFPAYI